MRTADPGGKNGTLYEGFVVDILRELSQSLNFDFDLDLVEDSRYGALSAGGNWNGMIGQLVRGKSDIAAAPLIVTSMRARVVDFTQLYMRSGPQILMKKRTRMSMSLFGDACLLLEPLPLEVWVLTIFAYITVSVLLYVIWRWSPFEWGAVAPEMSGPLKESFNLKNSFFFSLSTLLWQGYRVAPRSVSGRIIAGVWWAFTVFLLLSYTASLTGTVLTRYTPTDHTIRTFDDLAKSGISYGTIAGGSTLSLFKHSKIPTRHMMWEKMNQDKSAFCKTTAEGIQRVRQSEGKYAFIMDSPTAEYAALRKPCDLLVTGEPLTDNGYAFACRKGSGLCSELSQAMLMLKESNRLDLLRRKWFRDECTHHGGSARPFFTGGQAALTLKDFAMVFVLVLIGIVLAVVALIVEIVLNRKGIVNFKSERKGSKKGH